MRFPVSESFIRRQIEQGKRLIDHHSVVFFDVFDTLLARDCAAPEDVLRLLEQQAGADAPPGFREMRQQAERACREKTVAPTFDEIYAALPLEKDRRERLKTLELELERRLSTRKYTGFALYRYARERNKRIAAVSDMYLSAEFIREMLTAAGYAIDTVIVSCEHRAEKYDGKLFQTALAQVSAKRREVVHFGDNPVSDILGAVRAGISALWLPARKRLAYVKPCGDPFSDTYLLPFLANHVPLLEDPVAALGYETCGPMLVGFCQWLHERLHEGGYERALFCARDMLQTYRLYLSMYPEDRGLARYFYVSRKSLLPAYNAAEGNDASKEAHVQSENVLFYLEQMGCSGKTALIDSGLNGRSQRMLTHILNGRMELHGFYIRVSKTFYQMVQDAETGVYMYPEKPEVMHMVSSMLFETLVAATHGRTIAYGTDAEGVISPVLGEGNPDDALIRAYQSGADRFTEDYLASAFGNRAIPAEAVQEVMLRLAFFPRAEDVRLLNNLNCGNEKYEPLYIRRKRIYYALHGLVLFRDLKDSYWKGGFLRYCFPRLAPLISRVYVWADRFVLNRIGEWKNPREPD